MRVEVLVPREGRALASATLTYIAPPALAQTLQPGHLVAVPLGERLVAGIVWALDAADEVNDTLARAQAEASTDSEREEDEEEFTVTGKSHLREIASLLHPDPVLLPAQRTLAEQIADAYAAPLALAARLFLPPGLLASARLVLCLPPHISASEPAKAPTEARGGTLPSDQAVVLTMVRESRAGIVDRQEVRAVLGATRASRAVRSLLTRGLLALRLELSESFRDERTVRIVRLAAPPTRIEEWRARARGELDAVATPVTVESTGTARKAIAKPSTRALPAERLLRQLAVIDVLSRESNTGQGGWRYEELRRLTRATPSLLSELERAGLIAIEDVPFRYDPLAGQTFTPSIPPALTTAQSAAVATIVAGAGRDQAPAPTPTGNEQSNAVFLLHGITGSGKTEVYLRALAETLTRGLRAIVLVPEIALTPQAMARFAGRFPGRVALLHSGLTDAERLDEWRRIRAGKVDIVLGSRSALFAPVERLGLIVVDEEHEVAYKEEARPPTYHARDVAVRLGALTGAAVVLGSATPSVEAYYAAQQGQYRLLELRERAPTGRTSEPDTADSQATSGDAHPEATSADTVTPYQTSLPPVTVIDLRAELRAGNTSILSDPLRAALAATLERGEQAILFLNRRGTASSVVCRECGYVAKCRSCDVSMTYHAGEREIICHYCGRRERALTECPVCHGTSIRFFGVGTERVEMGVRRLFPAARVLRWDRDTAKTRQTHEELLRAFAERRADILVGTQMIAKGLDLPGVTLVGVVAADIALNLPDFRASERAFQLLTQVAGRAGRGALPGQVLVQTFNPEHFCIQAASRHDYATFVAAELAARAAYGYPPYRRFIKCTFQHADRYTAQVEAYALANELQMAIDALALPATDLVGPAPAFIERLRGRYRWQVLARSPDPAPLLRFLAQQLLPFGWTIDVDPVSTL